MTGDDERAPTTRPMPAVDETALTVDETAPTEQLTPLPATVPLPSDVPPPPLIPPQPVVPSQTDVEAVEDAVEAAQVDVAGPAEDAVLQSESASTSLTSARQGAGPDAPTQGISGLAPIPKRPRPKQRAWSNLPNSEPIPLGAVAGGVDVTGTHPTLPPVTASYTAALAAAATGAVVAAGATVADATTAATAATGTTATTGTIGSQTAVTDTRSDVSGTGADSEPEPADKPKRRRRRRGLIVGLSVTVVVLVVLGVAGAFAWQVAETRTASAVKQTVQQKVDKALGFPASHPVAVTFDEPVLPQVRAGSLDKLSFTVAGVPLVGTTGTVTMHATDVPTSGSGDPKTLDTTVRLKSDPLKALVNEHRNELGQILPGSVKVDGSTVTVSLNPAQFLSGVSFAEELKATIDDGTLTLTPSRFVVGGTEIDADTVRARFGGLASGILETRSICLADTYPAGMTLTGIDVKKNTVVADFDVKPGILSDPELQKKGTCK